MVSFNIISLERWDNITSSNRTFNVFMDNENYNVTYHSKPISWNLIYIKPTLCFKSSIYQYGYCADKKSLDIIFSSYFTTNYSNGKIILKFEKNVSKIDYEINRMLPNNILAGITSNVEFATYKMKNKGIYEGEILTLYDDNNNELSSQVISGIREHNDKIKIPRSYINLTKFVEETDSKNLIFPGMGVEIDDDGTFIRSVQAESINLDNFRIG